MYIYIQRYVQTNIHICIHTYIHIYVSLPPPAPKEKNLVHIHGKYRGKTGFFMQANALENSAREKKCVGKKNIRRHKKKKTCPGANLDENIAEAQDVGAETAALRALLIST